VLAKLASRNEHKARELERALPGWRIELLDAVELPPEEGETYYENARAKAEFGRSVAGPDFWVLGEDSGIEVDALGGKPGVHSARWARPGRHIDQLLAELEGVTDRRARYRCELVCLSPSGELRGSGTLEGTIATEPRGSEGFGYDPIFIPEGQTQTVAELGNDWKVQNSHRASAAHALARALTGLSD
jgi:XTP/dITP diphosphohydrolase